MLRSELELDFLAFPMARRGGHARVRDRDRASTRRGRRGAVSPRFPYRASGGMDWNDGRGRFRRAAGGRGACNSLFRPGDSTGGGIMLRMALTLFSAVAMLLLCGAACMLWWRAGRAAEGASMASAHVPLAHARYTV